MPGFDGYGPMNTDLRDALETLRCGDVLSAALLDSIGFNGPIEMPLSTHEALTLGRHFMSVEQRWDQLAGRYPGSAQYWRDLAGRARLSAQRVLRTGTPALTKR